MKKIFYLLLGYFLLAQYACKDRATEVEGYITDRVTGEPIAGATINYILYKKNSQGGRYESTETDASGFYMFSIPPNYGWTFYNVAKEGYLQKLFPAMVMGQHFESGEVNSFDVELIGLDGFIKIVAINSIPGNDSLFVQFFSQLQEEQFGFYGTIVPETYPIVLANGETYEEVVVAPGEELLKIYWNTSGFVIPDSSHKDSVFLHRLDTLLYTINF
jgi:hypothetical protein